MTGQSEQIARDMREGTFPEKSEATRAEDRARVSYDAFRNGFDGGVLPPEWEKAPSWIRDAIHVAYLQGKLDGHEQHPLSMESAAKLCEALKIQKPFCDDPKFRAALSIAARTIRRGRLLTPAEQNENLAKSFDDEGEHGIANFIRGAPQKSAI